MINVPDPYQAMKDQLVRSTQQLQQSVATRQVNAQRVADTEASARASRAVPPGKE